MKEFNGPIDFSELGKNSTDFDFDSPYPKQRMPVFQPATRSSPMS